MDSDTTSPAPPPEPREARRKPAQQQQQPPTRRRAWLACTTCRSRKTRCDAAKPRCSLCASLDVECVFKDSQQLRVDPGIKLLLERIQTLEDRLLSSASGLQSQLALQPPRPNLPDLSTALGFAGPSAQRIQPQEAREAPFQQQYPPGPSGGEANTHAATSLGGDSYRVDVSLDTPPSAPDLPYPHLHTANANHVLNWPLVQGLLSAAFPTAEDIGRDGQLPFLHEDATDVFFRSSKTSSEDDSPAETWRLFGDSGSPHLASTIEDYRGFVRAYFDEVNVFFPLLSRSQVSDLLDRTIGVEFHGNDLQARNPSPALYCLLLLVLCIGSFVRSGSHRIRKAGEDRQRSQHHPQADHLWSKAALLLGHVCSASSLEAAQCTMLASIYLGSCGRIPEAFHWSHTTSTKCIALVKKHQHSFSEAFRRLFWISFICESDFISEISIIQPSGIARYQDQVPYPTQASPTSQNESHAPSTLDSGVASPFEEPTGGNGRESRRNEGEELAAFQICTNIAIRRLLNSVHSLVYDSKDHFRMKRVEYVRWLLRVTGDFWTYHGTIYRNVPQFLFVSMPPWRDNTHIPMSQPQSHHTPRTEGLGNDPWNVLRLQGRYYASQHIIHRPFVDYVLINMDHIQTHPDLDTILQKCALCFEGCKGFISVFNINEANSITCLFATGVATFTYLVILRLATTCQIFQDVVPNDIEEVLGTGRRNLELFGVSIPEFEHHLEILDKLDAACRDRMSA